MFNPTIRETDPRKLPEGQDHLADFVSMLLLDLSDEEALHVYKRLVTRANPSEDDSEEYDVISRLHEAVWYIYWDLIDRWLRHMVEKGSITDDQYQHLLTGYALEPEENG